MSNNIKNGYIDLQTDNLKLAALFMWANNSMLKSEINYIKQRQWAHSVQ